MKPYPKPGRPKSLKSMQLLSFHCTRDQWHYLQHINKVYGTSYADQVRQGIDMYIKASEENLNKGKKFDGDLDQYKTLTLEEALECNKISADDWLRGIRPKNFRK